MGLYKHKLSSFIIQALYKIKNWYMDVIIAKTLKNVRRKSSQILSTYLDWPLKKIREIPKFNTLVLKMSNSSIAEISINLYSPQGINLAYCMLETFSSDMIFCHLRQVLTILLMWQGDLLVSLRFYFIFFFKKM
jgi:hypothetical protein